MGHIRIHIQRKCYEDEYGDEIESEERAGESAIRGQVMTDNVLEALEKLLPGLLRLEIEGEHTVTCEGLLALKQHCGKFNLIAVGTDNDSNHWWKSDIVVLRQALLSALSG